MMSSKSRWLVACIVGLLSCAITNDELQAQRKKKSSGLDVSVILKNFDTNKNGFLDANEMSGRTKDFVRRSGLDPNRSHSIASIARVLNEKSKKEADQKNAKSGNDNDSQRKVPGFGVEVERMGVPDFSPSGEERMSDAAMRKKFGDSVMAQVDRTMTRYDKDKNGLIDPKEQTRTRWTNPSAAESDKNGDTNLSRLELAYRYKERADKALKRNTAGNNKTTSTKALSRAKSLSSRAKSTSNSTKYTNNRSTARGRNTHANRTSSSRQSAASNSKGFNSGNDAYIRYAEGLLKNYDKNKDKKLSKKEMEEMRRPPKNADTNKDGFVDKNELIASVNGNSRGKSKSTSSSSRGSKVLADKRRESSKTYNDADSVFGGKDANGDKQLQMSEFASEWDKDAFAEFKSKDLNNDGVITAAEWTGR